MVSAQRATQGRQKAMMTPTEALADAMTETQLLDAITACAVSFGWMAYHDQDSRRNESGYPDLTLVRRPRVVIAELKKEKRWRFSFEQPQWLNEMAQTPAEVFLWLPSHWHSGAVEEVLRSRGPMPEDVRLTLGGWHPDLAVGKTNKPKLKGMNVRRGGRR